MEINYQEFLDEALLEVAKKALRQVQSEGLKSNHHFYITLRTDDPLVVLSDKMRQRYPEEITIVLQYQFEDLLVGKDSFSVKLNFNGIRETLEIPFRAITSFADPSVNFHLHFNNRGRSQPAKFPSNTTKSDVSNDGKKATEETTLDDNKTANVIALDKFRNKHKPK